MSYPPGYVLCDMNDGLSKVPKDLALIRGSQVIFDTDMGTKFISDLLSNHLEEYYHYTNKCLVVLPPSYCDYIDDEIVLAGYSYDARHLSFLKFRKVGSE